VKRGTAVAALCCLGEVPLELDMLAPVLTLVRRGPSARLIRFGVVGLIGVAVNLALVRLFYGQLNWPAPIASALAVEVSIVNNFFWNNRWTFGERTITWTRFIRYNLTSLGGLVITAIVFTGLMTRFGVPYLLADLVGIGLATAWNFGASIRWTWAS
jgi:dolichol-phosphate mannosyltransferase